MSRHAILFHPRTGHERNYKHFHIPYSLLSVATTLDPLLPCLLIDNNVHQCDHPAALLSSDPREWALVGISVMIGHQIRDALAVSEFVKDRAPSCPVVWGGACPTMLPELVLTEPHVDYVVVGQGEEAIRSLWQAVELGDFSALSPRVRDARRGDNPSSATAQLVEIDQFPLYHDFYELVEVGRYFRADRAIADRTVNYHSSQGCGFRCGFCCEPVLWDRSWTGRPAAGVLDDLQVLVEDYGANGIKFHDSEFFINRQRVVEFARGLLQRDLRIRWAASGHPRTLLQLGDEEWQLLRKSGLSRILVGAESASEDELTLCEKRAAPHHVAKVVDRCTAHDISASLTFVTGFPGSQIKHVRRTLALAEKLVDLSQRHEAKIHFYAPYPGTPLFDVAVAHGFESPGTLEAWADYDYYYIQTPWVSPHLFDEVRAFNEAHYPNLIAED